MKFGFAITSTEDVYAKLDVVLEKEKDMQEAFSDFHVADYEKIVIGIICVWPKADKFHGVLPVVSKKRKTIGFGIRLNHDYMVSLPEYGVWEYIKAQIEDQINVLDDIRNKEIDKELLKRKIVDSIRRI